MPKGGIQSNGLLRSLLYLSPFVFPLYLIRFELLGLPFTLLEFYLYGLFGFWLWRVVAGQQAIRWDKSVRRPLLAAGLLLLGVSLGAAFAGDLMTLPSGESLNAQRVAWGVWKGWVLAPLLYFWVLLQSVQKPDQVDKLLKAFVCSGAVWVVASYGFGLWGQGLTYDARLSGPFESANYLALYLLPAFLLASVFLLEDSKKSGLHRILGMSAWAILAHGLFFTQSYGAFLGAFGALLMYSLMLLFKKPAWRKKLFLALCIGALAFLALLVSQWNTPKFQQALDFSGRSSSSVRVEIYRTSLYMISQRPFLGVGPGLFEAHYQREAPQVLEKAPLEWNMPHAHNIFLAFWLNAGLLGFLALLILIVLVHRTFTYPLVAFWGVLIHGLVDVPFWKNDLAVVFWLLVAAMVLLQRFPKKQRDKI